MWYSIYRAGDTCKVKEEMGMTILERLNEKRTIIDEKTECDGLWQLWESNKYGDEREAIVTLNGQMIGKTWDGLFTFIAEYRSM